MSVRPHGPQANPRSQDPLAELGFRFQGLDAQQALRRNPIRWRTVQQLWVHAQQTSGDTRWAILGRLTHHLDLLEQNLRDPAEQPSQGHVASVPVRSGFDALLALLPPPEMPLVSLAPMRQTHARLKVRQQLRHTLTQPLQHAGPLHSERLVQQSLARLNQCSEAYLHRFMSYLDALATLEDAQSLVQTASAVSGAKPRAKLKAPPTTKR